MDTSAVHGLNPMATSETPSGLQRTSVVASEGLARDIGWIRLIVASSFSPFAALMLVIAGVDEGLAEDRVHGVVEVVDDAVDVVGGALFLDEGLAGGFSVFDGVGDLLGSFALADVRAYDFAVDAGRVGVVASFSFSCFPGHKLS